MAEHERTSRDSGDRLHDDDADEVGLPTPTRRSRPLDPEGPNASRGRTGGRGRGMLAVGLLVLAGWIAYFAEGEFSVMNVVNVRLALNLNTTRLHRNATNATAAVEVEDEGCEESGPATTDFFVMLPGREMDARNIGLFAATHDSVLARYNESYVHVVYNLGDASYLRRYPNESQREDHIVQNNNFALGAFAAAAGWMGENRPCGNFVILQHSMSLVAAAGEPVCDIESVNTRQRCGGPCAPANNHQMLTPFGTTRCFPILNEIMGLYNVTCGFPCCPFADRSDEHIDVWPLMAHNPVLFTPRAREFLRPLAEHVRALPPGHVGKNGDQGTERLFGLFSTMLIGRHGPARDANVTVAGKTYSDAEEAHVAGVFACSQDLTTKVHGKVPGRRSLARRVAADARALLQGRWPADY